jgi:hypothetical protein
VEVAAAAYFDGNGHLGLGLRGGPACGARSSLRRRERPQGGRGGGTVVAIGAVVAVDKHGALARGTAGCGSRRPVGGPRGGWELETRR